MSGGFGVDPSALSGIGDGIRQAVGQVASRGGGAAPGAAVGHDGLAAALEQFGGRWQQGVGILTADGARYADGLTESARAYQEVEQRITDALGHTGQ